MQIVAAYSFNRGKERIAKKYPDLMTEVNEVIKQVDSTQLKTKKSIEKTMQGRMLYSPRSLNGAFKRAFKLYHDWKTIRVPCAYPSKYYIEGYEAPKTVRGAFREMDFVKKTLGVEI